MPTIDNSQNHDEAMAVLCEAGIYLALDANTPTYSLNRQDIDFLHAPYNDIYLQSVYATIDAFKGYSNLLFFLSGNEVIDIRNNTNAAPYIKAVTHHMKNYIRAQASRGILPSTSLAARTILPAPTCSPSSTTPGATHPATKSPARRPRSRPTPTTACHWNEIEAVYSPEMMIAYSGGLVYEYTLEATGYELVEVDNGQSIPNDDLDRLKATYEATPNPEGDGGARENRTTPECPAVTGEWYVATTLLPEMP
ncbi:glycoside hydrolase family 72 protein [Dothistroma septosporum NZE10]|uniref:1,3-beta-glucanosyltransferase n=1 Tax=Dothistroma septosporum (strain NZE10 / CBS 128990) TaxID=675120 RepID=M2YJ84_DOTSN|nr:glycoside hydrolase family 72 protein [Dothistroma septosporum NZE10]